MAAVRAAIRLSRDAKRLFPQNLFKNSRAEGFALKGYGFGRAESGREHVGLQLLRDVFHAGPKKHPSAAKAGFILHRLWHG